MYSLKKFTSSHYPKSLEAFESFVKKNVGFRLPVDDKIISAPFWYYLDKVYLFLPDKNICQIKSGK